MRKPGSTFISGSTDAQRRDFLKTSLSAAALAALPGLSFLKPSMARAAGFDFGAFSPIAGVPLSQSSSLDFNGDEINRPHDLLWHKVSYLQSKGGVPRPTETTDVVVIGGGISGLTAAYRLRDLKPIVLEQASRFGGNSKGERYGNAEYSIGAAYISAPDEGDDTDTLLRELGVYSGMRLETGDESAVNFKGELVHPFWQGASDPSRADEFDRVYQELMRIGSEAYPDIPRIADSQISDDEFNTLDRMNVNDWLNVAFGGVHPHIEEYLQLYAWSSYGASLEELSAAQMLNFISSDIGGTIALPGGNAGVAHALLKKLAREMPASNLRAGAFVIDVTADDEGVTVCYEDAGGTLRSIRARTCVVTSPKVVAKHAVNDIPRSQLDAMNAIQYRAYLVANVIVEGPFTSPAYELFCLEGNVPEAPRPLKPEARPFTDICFGTWAAQDQTDVGVLTIYKGLAYDGARQLLFHPNSHNKHKGRIENALPGLLSTLGVAESQVKGVRMTRWGHSLPLAKQGLIASGTLQLASLPIRDRIFFAQQDNWANPSFETATATAYAAAAMVREKLQG